MEPIKTRQGTVCFFTKEDKILLFLIEYGPNDRKWNGLGGWVEVGETLEEGLAREIKEEISLDIDTSKLTKIHTLKDKLGKGHDLVVFTLEADGLTPNVVDNTIKAYRWFDKDKLPLDKMWPNNNMWLPQVLQ